MYLYNINIWTTYNFENIPLNSWRTNIFIYKNQIRTPFQDQSGMDVSNLLSCRNTSIVPPRLDPLLGSLGLLPSFDNLTFLDKIVLRDTRWRDVLGKMYVMWMYAYVSWWRGGLSWFRRKWACLAGLFAPLFWAVMVILLSLASVLCSASAVRILAAARPISHNVLWCRSITFVTLLCHWRL